VRIDRAKAAGSEGNLKRIGALCKGFAGHGREQAGTRHGCGRSGDKRASIDVHFLSSRYKPATVFRVIIARSKQTGCGIFGKL
jgi:hypothetical protein